jgi:hypothetical protein
LRFLIPLSDRPNIPPLVVAVKVYRPRRTATTGAKDSICDCCTVM